jgi:hypothetical protein
MSGNIWPTNYFTQKPEKSDNTEKTEDEEEPELISKEDIIDSLPATVEVLDENTTTKLEGKEEDEDTEEEETEEIDKNEEESDKKEAVNEDTDEEDNDEEDEIRNSENDDFDDENTHQWTSAFDSGIGTPDLFLSSYTVNRTLETYIVSINSKPIYYNHDPNSAKKLMWGVVKSFTRNLMLNHPEYNVRLSIVSDNKVKIFTSYRFYAISYESLLHTISFNRAVQATPTNA